MIVTGLFQPYSKGTRVFYSGEVATFIRSAGLKSEIEHADYDNESGQLLGVTRSWVDTPSLTSE